MHTDGSGSDIRKIPLGRRLRWGAVAGLAAGLVALGLSQVGYFQELEDSTLDLRQQLLARPSVAVQKVAIILVDEYSIRTMWKSESVRFPWPRDVYNAFLDYLKIAGARGVVFDILFADPDPRSKTDRAFGDAIREAGNVVLAAKLELRPPDLAADKFEIDPSAIERARVNAEGWDQPPWEDVGLFLAPVPEILAGRPALGFVNVQQDGGRLRRADLLQTFPARGSIAQALPLAAARLGSPAEVPIVVEGGVMRWGGPPAPLGADGRPLVRFYGPPGTIPTENAYSIIASLTRIGEEKPPIVDPQIFHDRVVFIGINAGGKEDVVTSPVSDRMPGVEFQATVCANLLGGEFLRRPDALGRALILLAVSVTAGLLLFAVWSPVGGALTGLGFWSLLAAAAAAAYLSSGPLQVIDLFFPAIGVGGAYVAAIAAAYFAEGKQRRDVARAFGQYMSPVVIREVMRSPERLKLGGESREIAVYFSDIAGFSSFSEKMTDTELVSFLNAYLTPMSDAILERRGVVDKYIGDAIMAFWGAPAPVEAPGREACLAVVEQRRILAQLNAEFLARGLPQIGFRVGLSQGPATVGNMGSTRRFNYTAMGDTVNLASRLEGANKHFGTNVLMTEAVRASAGGAVAARRIGKVQVVGKSVPSTIYELIKAEAELRDDERRELERFHTALELLERGATAEAAAQFDALAEESKGSSRLIDLCREKCHDLRQTGRTWDGVWVLTSKG